MLNDQIRWMLLEYFHQSSITPGPTWILHFDACCQQVAMSELEVLVASSLTDARCATRWRHMVSEGSESPIFKGFLWLTRVFRPDLLQNVGVFSSRGWLLKASTPSQSHLIQLTLQIFEKTICFLVSSLTSSLKLWTRKSWIFWR